MFCVKYVLPFTICTMKLGNFMFPRCPVPAFRPSGTASISGSTLVLMYPLYKVQWVLTFVVHFVRQQWLLTMSENDIFGSMYRLLVGVGVLRPLDIGNVSHCPNIFLSLESQELVDFHKAIMVEKAFRYVRRIWNESYGWEIQVDLHFLAVRESQLSSPVWHCCGPGYLGRCHECYIHGEKFLGCRFRYARGCTFEYLCAAWDLKKWWLARWSEADEV